MEEDMKILEEYIKLCKTTGMDKKRGQAIENLISRYKELEAINKEIDYRQDYETWKSEESALVDLVEKYCKYNNKYEAIDLFKEIDKQYEIKIRKEK